MLLLHCCSTELLSTALYLHRKCPDLWRTWNNRALTVCWQQGPRNHNCKKPKLANRKLCQQIPERWFHKLNLAIKTYPVLDVVSDWKFDVFSFICFEQAIGRCLRLHLPKTLGWWNVRPNTSWQTGSCRFPHWNNLFGKLTPLNSWTPAQN